MTDTTVNGVGNSGSIIDNLSIWGCFKEIFRLEAEGKIDHETAKKSQKQFRKKILKKFPLKQAGDGGWFITIRFAPGDSGRKMFKKVNREDLENAICEFVGNKYVGNKKINPICDILKLDGVYLITDGKYVKIGVARNLRNRLKELQTGNPNKLEVLTYQKFPNAYDVEKALHKKYKNQKLSGEWFDILDEIGSDTTIQYLL